MTNPLSIWLARSQHRLLHARQVDVNAPLLCEAEVRQLRLAIQALGYRRETAQRYAGDLRSVHLGSGLDFEEARPYQPGDDVRGMDWRSTARTNKPYVKVYREEHQPALHLLIDRGASMRFGTRGRLKVTQAARIVALLALQAAASQTCIGATLWQAKLRSVPCRQGEIGALQVIEAAIAACPPSDDGSDAPMLAPVLSQLDAELPRGSRLVLISDFSRLQTADSAALLRLANRHQVHAIQVLDASEINLPNVGLMCFQDAASGVLRRLDTGSQRLRTAFSKAAAVRHAAQQTVFRAAGISLSLCLANTDDLTALASALSR